MVTKWYGFQRSRAREGSTGSRVRRLATGEALADESGGQATESDGPLPLVPARMDEVWGGLAQGHGKPARRPAHQANTTAFGGDIESAPKGSRTKNLSRNPLLEARFLTSATV